MMYFKYERRIAYFSLPLAWMVIIVLSHIGGAEYHRCYYPGKAWSAAIFFNLTVLAACLPYFIWQSHCRPAAQVAALCGAAAWNIYLLSEFWRAAPDCWQGRVTGLEYLGQAMVRIFAGLSAVVFVLLALGLLWRKPCALQHSVWSAVLVVWSSMAATVLLIWILLKIGLS